MNLPDPGPIDIDPDARRLRLLRWAAGVLLGLGLAACVAEGANRPPDPRLGFGDVTLIVARGEHDTAELCALLAETAEERAQGLMGITDLDGRVGMVFSFPEADGPVDVAFFMRDTPLPLTVAFFAADGTLLGTTDMDPCPPGTDCPVYPPPAPYAFALEVPQGDLAELGITPATQVAIGERGCPSG